jgi:hypothetical protein
MNTKQKKQMKHSLTKRLMVGVILSIAVGNTAAVACTHVVNTTNGCPVLSPSFLPNMYLYSGSSSASCQTVQPFSGNYYNTFNVYSLGVRGTVTATWIDEACGTAAPYGLYHAFLSVSNVQWTLPNGTKTTTAYTNPSNYGECCLSGT